MIAQKQIKSWIPIAEYIFVKFMPVGNGESDAVNASDEITISGESKEFPPTAIQLLSKAKQGTYSLNNLILPQLSADGS